jgi:hypothetical protein
VPCFMSITEGNYFLPDFQPPRIHFLLQNRYVFCHRCIRKIINSLPLRRKIASQFSSSAYVRIIWLSLLVLFVRIPFTAKQAGLDPQSFAGRPQIRCGISIAKKKLGKNILRPQRSQEDKPYYFKKGVVCQLKTGKVCPPATFEAGAKVGVFLV